MGDLPAIISRREREAWARARAEFPDRPISREDEDRWEATLAAVESERDARAEEVLRYRVDLDAANEVVRGLRAERDALRGAVEAVRVYPHFCAGCARELAALLAAAQIEAGLATSRERPGA